MSSLNQLDRIEDQLVSIAADLRWQRAVMLAMILDNLPPVRVRAATQTRPTEGQ